MQKWIRLFCLYVSTITLLATGQSTLFFGQVPPGQEPEIFAPGMVSNQMYNRDFTISPDGQCAYFSVVLGQNKAFTIMESRLVDGKWTDPVMAPFVTSLEDVNLEPCISPSGDRLFFMSNRLGPGEQGKEKNEDIWVVDRIPGGWSEPYNLGPPVSTEAAEFFPSLTRDGTLYFTRRDIGGRAEFIYRSRLVNGKYSEPEKLSPNVNGAPTQFNACIAPDESYIIVPSHGREDSIGGIDYYVSFRDQNDTWTGPINLGDKINTPGSNEYSPSISPDGKYLFFMSARIDLDSLPEGRLSMEQLIRFSEQPGNGLPDVYWVNTSVIETLRPKKIPTGE